jgi:hypothetical protein
LKIKREGCEKEGYEQPEEQQLDELVRIAQLIE